MEKPLGCDRRQGKIEAQHTMEDTKFTEERQSLPVLTDQEQKRHIHHAIKFFHPDPGEVFEIRALGPHTSKSPRVFEGYAGGKKSTISGYFDDPIKATEAAAALDDIGCRGIYLTLNRVNKALLARANNRLKVAGEGETTKDTDILLLHWLLIDIDPKRPSGISSTREEHQAALDHALWLKGVLSSKGWSDPLFADSGNGAHLVYRLPGLANTEENKLLLQNVLNALNDLYGVAKDGTAGFIQLDIDTTVFNPARISKTYGTWARKGDDTPERPHRQARFLSVPEDPQAVSIEMLRAIIAQIPRDHQGGKPTGKSDTRTSQRAASGKFDLPGYIEHYGVKIKTVKQHGGSTLHVLETCLFDSSHAGGEAHIGQAADGTLFYNCFHNSCKGRSWQEARKKISNSDHLGQFVEGYQPGKGLGIGATEEPPEIKIMQWPTLPDKARSGMAGAFVELATRNSEADPAAVLATFLCRFGVECGPGPYLMIGDTKHYPRLNAVVVGNSSKARKGTSGKPVSRVFIFDGQERKLDDPLLYIPARETPGPLSSGEGLIYAVRDEVKGWQVDKKTGEGKEVTLDPGVKDKRLFVLDEELAAALQCTRREGNTLSTVIRSAFDNGKLDPLTKTNRIQATGAHIGIVSHITNAELNRLLDETQSLNGFANRFLWTCARRQKLVPIPEPMPERELRKMQRELLRILSVSRSIGHVTLSEQARDYWIEVYPHLSEEQPGLVGCVINRAETLAARLALIYALLDGSGTIEFNHLESALAMWAYAKESAKYIFSGREANPISQKILDACEKGPISLTDIYGLLSNHATRQQVSAAIQELMVASKVEVTDEVTSGRPKKIISLAKKAKEAKKRYAAGDDEGLNSHNSHFSQRKNKNEDPDTLQAEGPDDNAEVF